MFVLACSDLKALCFKLRSAVVGVLAPGVRCFNVVGWRKCVGTLARPLGFFLAVVKKLTSRQVNWAFFLLLLFLSLKTSQYNNLTKIFLLCYRALLTSQRGKRGCISSIYKWIFASGLTVRIVAYCSSVLFFVQFVFLVEIVGVHPNGLNCRKIL